MGAEAQTVNPSKVAWDYTASEHAAISKYQLGYFMGGAEPFQTVDIAKGSVSPVGTGSYETPLPRPILGTFTAKLRAVAVAAGGGEVASEWSNATTPFSLSPLPIVGLRLVP